MATEPTGLVFRVLGPFEVTATGQAVHLGGPRLRAVLARLLVAAGRPVGVTELVNEIWTVEPPPDASRTVRTYVSRLRSALSGTAVTSGAREILATRAPGYMLQIDEDTVDALRFKRLAAAGRQALAAGSPGLASERLAAALAMWRSDDAYGEFAACPVVAAAGARLNRQRLDVLEDRIEADLATGNGHDLVTEIESLVRAHPTRERLWGQLMVALYRSGRQSDALVAFRKARDVLVTEHGVDPSPDLLRIHQRILAQDPALVPAGDRPTHARAAGIAGQPVPAQLPPPLPGFTGRDQERRFLDLELAAAASIIAISGTAGVGKTALATHWAHQIADRFPDGQLYVNLRGFDPVAAAALDPSTVARAFLEALGVPPTKAPANGPAQTGLYRSLVAGRRMLIVLDNARDEDQVRPLLPGSPGCLVLVTSRSRLAGLVATDGARPLGLELLTGGQSQALLAGRFGPRRAAGEVDAVAEIAARCAGLPLALAIVAARAVIRPGLPLAALAAQLRDATDVMDALRGDQDPATDLRAVFSWSYRTLSTAAARLFLLLGLHPGPDIGAAAAASLAGLPRRQVDHLLVELADASLATEHFAGRYTLHDLLRSYAVELAATEFTAGEQHAAIARLLDHYLHTGHAAALTLHPAFSPIHVEAPVAGVTPEPVGTLPAAQTWFAAERAVLPAVARHAADNGFAGHTWRLSWAVSRDLDRHGYWHDWFTLAQLALNAAERAGDVTGQAHSHRELGMTHHRFGRDAPAQSHLHLAGTLFRLVGDPAGEAHTHLNLGMSKQNQGRLADAADHGQHALTLFGRAGNAAGKAYALNAIGWNLTLLGDHRRAIDLCEQAVGLLRTAADVQGEADTWDSLGHAHHRLGERERAVTCYRRALRLFDRVGDAYGAARTYVNLAEAQWDAARYADARTAWRKAVEIFDDLGHLDAVQARADLMRPVPATNGVVAATSPH